MVHPSSPGCLDCHRRTEIESPAELLGSTLFAGEVDSLSNVDFHPKNPVQSTSGAPLAGAFLSDQCCQCHWAVRRIRMDDICADDASLWGPEPNDGPASFPGVPESEALGR